MGDKMKKFILLDRDGTIIVDKHYLSDPEGVELLPGAVEGLKKMQSLGYGLIVLTNQSGIGRGYYSEEDMHAVNRRMEDLLAEHGVKIDKICFCPHAPDQPCTCRKPATGMIEDAAQALPFTPEDSIMIGDKACDVDCGRKAGALSILVRTGKGAKEEAGCADRADYVADDLLDAANFISSR